MSEGHLASDTLWWRDGDGRRYVTLIAEVTFRLRHGQVAEPTSPVAAALDPVPFKRRADVTVVGVARAPEGRRVRRLVVGVSLSRGRELLLSKELVVTGERSSADAEPRAFDEADLRVLDPTGLARVFSAMTPEPGTLRPTRTHSHSDALDDDVDLTGFQCSAEDQRVDYLLGGELITLRGFHAAQAVFRSRLPGLAVEAVTRMGRERRTPAMVADTLRIDAEASTATVTWRGVARVPDGTTPEHVRFEVALVPAARVWDGEPTSTAASGLELTDRSAMAAACIPWSQSPDEHRRALIVKGTFDVVEGEKASLAEQQRDLSGDLHHDDEPGASLRYATDFAPFKPQADVTLLGWAYPPPGQSAARVALRLGAVDKTVAAMGDRVWTAAGAATDPAPVERVPLRYEHAFGGADVASNPVGMGAGTAALPNLERPGDWISRPTDRPEPACFGPIATTWAPRWPCRGTFDAKWQRNGWPQLPRDFDWSHFNAAPIDQRCEFLDGDESFAVTCVRRGGEALRGKLPGKRPRAVVVRQMGAEEATPELVALSLDTVFIDAEAAQLQLVWRGSFAAIDEDASDVRRVLLVAEDLGSPRDREQLFAAALIDQEPVHAPPPEEPFTVADLRAELRGAQVRRLDGGLGGEARSPTVPVAVAAPAPPTRAEVQAMLDDNESLAGRDLSGADMSGLDLCKRDLRGAILRDARLMAAQCDGAMLAGAVLVGARASRASFVGADLSRVDAAGARLDFANLSDANLEQASFSDALLDDGNLANARASQGDFVGASLRRAKLDRAKLHKADLSRSVLDGATFEEAELSDAKLYEARGEKVSMNGATLTDARLEAASLPLASLKNIRGSGSVWERATLRGAHMHQAELKGAVLSGADLSNAMLTQADATGAVFRDAVLEGASLVRANLMQCDLEGANLTKADLRGANLYQAELNEARMAGAKLDQALLAGTKLAQER